MVNTSPKGQKNDMTALQRDKDIINSIHFTSLHLCLTEVMQPCDSIIIFIYIINNIILLLKIGRHI